MPSHIPSSLPPGPLISIINRARAIFLNEQLKPYNLSAGQLPVFMCLLHHPNITQDSMARYFHLDKGTIARTVKKMEDSEYITRAIDPDNRRAFRISLTEKGYRIAPEICAIDHRWGEIVTNNLTEQERTIILSFLHKIAETSVTTIQNLESESCNPVIQTDQKNQNK